MSDAKKCDRCCELYEIARGVVALDVHVAEKQSKQNIEDEGWTWSQWSRVDFSPDCSKAILEAIGTAIKR